MKKKFIGILMSLAVVASLTACGSGDSAPAETEDTQTTADNETLDDPEAVAEKTTFTVGFDASFPPYGYKDDNGEYVGFDLDLAQEVCDRLGYELVKQPIDWDAKDMELSSGTIDCIWNGFTINGREDKYCWSEPYIDNSQVFVVSADSDIKTKADLAGKTVVVQADSSALKALESDENVDLTNSFAELVQVSDYNTAFMNMEAGAADVVAMDVGVAKYQLEERNGEFVILEEELASEVYGVGFELSNTALRDQVQGTLNEMIADGTFVQIAEKWGLQDSVILETK
ncbi:MAG: amino acid ABC transporter substrate-binding protein [Lachnospiraceae bacterium]|nr:amino acid ABC transporter substrate-binding protein [Lachnospiraceae bacterium]